VLVVAGGDRAQGATAIHTLGCGACHMIPGIRDATGTVGPPLIDFGRRGIIAGQLPNTSENLIRWIQVPQSIEPGTAMPNLGATAQQARDIAAYLAALR
jgi:cytochrome c1